jgi:hypothetical protein
LKIELNIEIVVHLVMHPGHLVTNLLTHHGGTSSKECGTTSKYTANSNEGE